MSKPKKTKIQEYSVIKKFIYRIKDFFVKNITSEPIYDTIKMLKKNIKKLQPREKHILHNFLKFTDKHVSDILVPRSDICAISIDSNIDDVAKLITKKVFTRIVVYRDTLDNIKGFIHIKDLFILLSNKEKCNIENLIRKPVITTPTMQLIDLLTLMQAKRTHIAVVVDEYGGTDGIVTIEDVIEEIFGGIYDEYDNQYGYEYKLIDATTIITNARVDIEDIERMLGITLKTDEDDCETIGGLVLARFGNVPAKGEVIKLSDNVVVEVLDVTPRILKQVKISLLL